MTRELADPVRVLAETAAFVSLVPYAPRFPYEVHVVARRHVSSLVELSAGERGALAGMLVATARAYDRLFGFVLPYVLSVHQAPADGGDWSDVAHLRVQLTPVHRTADKLKYLAGSELGGGAFVSDTVPEATAAELRRVMGTSG